LAGTATSEWDEEELTLPLYVVTVGEQSFLAYPDGDVARGNMGTFSLYQSVPAFPAFPPPIEADSGLNRAAKAISADLHSSLLCVVSRLRGVGWYAWPAECD
jgi:hypothetical protein